MTTDDDFLKAESMHLAPLAKSLRHIEGSIEAGALVALVRHQHPHAPPLPDRPALDELMRLSGWRFDARVRAFVPGFRRRGTAGRP